MEDVITIALKGQNGKVVGSGDYFSALNHGILSEFMQNHSTYNYNESLQKAADRIHSILEEIYKDLNNNVGILRYIPLNDRKKLIKVIIGCTGICKIVLKSPGKSSDCIAMLNLSSYKTHPKSKASERELDDAIKTIRCYSGMSLSERVDTINKVLARGKSGAIGSNAKKALFLQQVERGKGREFLNDASLKFLYANNTSQFTGHCGRVICSNEYIRHIQKRIFLHDASKRVLDNSKTYGELTLAQLKDIAKQIEKDLSAGKKEAKTLSPNHRENIIGAAKELDHLVHSNLQSKAKTLFVDIPLEDVTDRLHQLMRSAEIECTGYAIADEVQSSTNSPPITMSIFAAKTAKFILSVKNNAKYDIKRKPEWSSDWYVYEGDIIRFDAPGNMLFGYLGKVFGYTDNFLVFGAGVYQQITNRLYSSSGEAYFDDPYDTQMIQRGIAYYNKTHLTHLIYRG